MGNILPTLSLKSDRKGFTTFKAYKRSRIHKFGVLWFPSWSCSIYYWCNATLKPYESWKLPCGSKSLPRINCVLDNNFCITWPKQVSNSCEDFREKHAIESGGLIGLSERWNYFTNWVIYHNWKGMSESSIEFDGTSLYLF